MRNIPKISDAEWEVMNLVWQKSPITATEIVAELSKDKEWNHKTIGTFLNRLTKKKVLRYEQEGKRYLYSPNVKREDCIRQESRSFLDRVFGGEALPMLTHLAETAKLSEADIEQFKQILEKKGR